MGNLIFVDHFLLLHLFYSNDFICFSVSAHSYLSKSSSSNNFPWNEISYRNLCPLQPIIFWLFMKNFLLNKVFFLFWKLHLVHLPCEFIPSFFPFSFFIFCFRVFTFNVRFSASSFLFSAVTGALVCLSGTCSCCSWLCLSGRC